MRLFRLVSAGVGATVVMSMCVMSSASAAHQSASAKRVMCGGHVATIVGTDGNNRIIGTDGPDVINGLGGADLILGLGGNDIICGGTGNDVINAMSGTGGQPLYGNDGYDLCVYPHQESGNAHGCDGSPQPEALNSDPPSGGSSRGNVLRAQSVGLSAACTAGDGRVNLTLKGKVSANSDQSAKITVEPVLFTWNRPGAQWDSTFLGTHDLTLPGYDGKWHTFSVKNAPKAPSNGIYYVGYYIQWHSPDNQSIDGFLWTFETNYPKTMKGAVRNPSLCLPQLP